MAAYDPENVVNFKKMYRKQYSEIAISAADKFTPEQLFDFAVKYFEWAEANHIQAAETAAFQGRTFESKVHKARVFTFAGLRLFAGISTSSWDGYKKRPGYAEVVDFIETVIYEQKYQLAVNGIINAGMVAKDLGIDKNAQVNVTTTANAESTISTEEVKEAVASIIDKL